MLIVHAHPQPSQSRVVKDLLSVLQSRPGAEVRSLYELYPDFDIDIEAEQQALLRNQQVVWLAPVYWYSVPTLMKHWIDQVLAHGWAYGQGGEALKGKACWWVASAGGSQEAYTAKGMHKRPFADYVAPIEHTACFCGMQWFAPFVVHGGHATTPEVLSGWCASLQKQCEAFESLGVPGGSAP
jgi:glutathione-regulated potassium-efflux system ancillary protein KefF